MRRRRENLVDQSSKGSFHWYSLKWTGLIINLAGRSAWNVFRPLSISTQQRCSNGQVTQPERFSVSVVRRSAATAVTFRSDCPSSIVESFESRVYLLIRWIVAIYKA